MNTTTPAQAASTARCENCNYWNAKASAEGECRRHAPQTIAFTVDDSTKFESRFPVTKAADWCGDFSANR